MKHRNLFFSRDDNHSIFHLTEMFKESIWFIEKKETQEWITQGNNLTKDPLEAIQFKTQLEAISHCCVHKLGTEYTQTEHEFIDGIHGNRAPKDDN